MGAMKQGQGTCGTFQSFKLTYHARTRLEDEPRVGTPIRQSLIGRSLLLPI